MFTTHIEQEFSHLLRMAKLPAFKDHSWHRAKQMAKDCPSLYGNFPERLKAAMQSPTSARSTESGVSS